MVRSGRFREDLYYRLRELEIVLTPLRDRLADLGLFCERFLAEAAEELGYPESQRIHPDTIGRLQKHPWRGNIRELRHAIKGAALRAAGGMLLPSHLDLDRYELHLAAAAAGSAVLNVAASVPSGVPAEVGNSLTWKERLEAQEKDALQRSMEAAGGNLTRAAELFGVPRTTYREKLIRYGLLQP